MQEVIKRIFDYSLEELMGDRFAKYSREIIQDRALPDVRDGLKPVQRRILYGMYKERHTYDKPYVKSARSVGDIMGKYHPHGDSSIYEAMVRMSQWWKQNLIYIDMQGNNGSMDGDGPAAMRYTEARLSKICNELLKDIDKGTIVWAPNFDDTLQEPTVLPAKYPNLLVNGATGISAGYATNIPPHNLGEIIDATIKRIDSPDCRFETILGIVQGPDFPTGGIVEGKKGIIDAYQTGRGKIVVRSKTELVKNKGKEQIIVTEIPFEVNKASLVKKIDEIRIDKKIDGISEVRDESDREDSVRIAIDLKKDADATFVLHYLFKNTDLQVSYSYNMVSIVNRRPMTQGILPMLDAYIAHQREVITKRTEFDLEHARRRMHIVDGLIKALSILDDVIRVIRASKDKSDSRDNLMKEFEFTYEQAEAIITLQLYRLSNYDVNELIDEKSRLELIINGLVAILSDEEKLKGVMKEELRSIKKEYAVPRKTEIQDEITEIKIDNTMMLPKEDCVVVVTRDGYVKRVSMRSYGATDGDTLVKDGDYPIGIYEMNTMDTVLIFTDLGNYLYVPVHELPDLKWKELGKHISNIIKINPDENVIACMPVYDFDEYQCVTMFTKMGMVKRSVLKDFKVQRYTKPMTAMKLKDGDMVVSVCKDVGDEVFVSTKRGFGLRYSTSEIPVTGLKASGVKAITLKDDEVVSGHIFKQSEFISIFTDKGTAKRVRISDVEVTSRGRKGVLLVRDVKTNPYHILRTFIIPVKGSLGYLVGNDITFVKCTDLPIVDRYSTGTQISKHVIRDVFLPCQLEKKEEVTEIVEVIEEEVSSSVDLEQVDDRMMTIDDFLNNLD